MAYASHELALNLRQQISERHEQNKAIDAEVRDVLLRKLNGVRELGILVGEAKANLSPQQFAEVARDVPLDSLRAYMASAKQNPAPITEVESGMRSMRTLTLAFQTGGLLPFASGHELAHKLRQRLKTRPLSEWDPTDIEAAVAALQPVLSVHRQLRLFLDAKE
jgi:hypothetical protein